MVHKNKQSTMWVKKVSTFKVSVTLSNLNRFSKFLLPSYTEFKGGNFFETQCIYDCKSGQILTHFNNLCTVEISYAFTYLLF